MTTSYDRVPYKSFPFSQAHPSRLATIASLLGMSPAKIAGSRVLELACASGGNLLPMAEQYPAAQLVGVDASQTQIAEGEQAIAALDLPNIRLLHRNILEIDRDFGQFDYIIAHGVFSWVPADVRQKILEICSHNLAPQGVAYISYNAYPGWRFRGMIRDVMAYRARFFEAPEERLREARSLVAFLAQAVPTEGNPYGILLNEELKLLARKEDYYLIHEFLEDTNTPLYFHEFCEQADQHGLQYLGEADYSMMSVNNLPAEVSARLRQISTDVVQMEQYMDFVRNRLFRQTLVCHKEVKLNRNPSPARVFEMWAATNAQPETEITQLRSREKITFRRPGSTMTTVEPLVKAAMLHLRKVWPRWVPFQDLLAAARSLLSEGPVIMDAERDRKDSLTLAEPLLRCYATSHIDLSIDPLQPNLEVADLPRASRLAGYQSLTRASVTNLWHETVTLTDLQRHILRYLDGHSDRSAILGSLQRAVRSGQLVIHEKGQALTGDERIVEVLGAALDDNLKAIASKGLLLTGA